MYHCEKDKIQKYCYGGEENGRDYDQIVLTYIEYYHLKAQRYKRGFYIDRKSTRLNSSHIH